ncbi:hypothetical protein LCGC14_1103200 [marine sediment metagenome]|uniref:Uncharacterized protein n=1 Tax=marine sediment metagenome TaxID=412755 RepID=A0A0F9MDF6_9ZZZZ
MTRLKHPQDIKRAYYPVMGSHIFQRIPRTILKEHNEQAKKNHNQTLAELESRGGLDPTEILAIIEDRKWKDIDLQEADRQLAELVAAYHFE